MAPGQRRRSLVRDYGELAHALALPSAATGGPQMVAAVRAHLAALDGWLLVFDDAPPIGVAAWLPGGDHGHVLVTTMDASGDPIDVAPFDEDEAVAFLLARTGSRDTAAARDVATLLGGLPLAMQQAASCIPGEIASLADYAKVYRASQGALTDVGTVPGHATVAVTLRVVLDRLELLAMSSYFPFALSGEGLTWLVIDTSQNELLVAGLPS